MEERAETVWDTEKELFVVLDGALETVISRGRRGKKI